MSDVTVTITGPGGTINYEVEIIAKALRDAGCTVEVQNAHPEKDLEGMIKEIYKRLTVPDWAGSNYPSLHGVIKKSVKVVANHCPWGG